MVAWFDACVQSVVRQIADLILQKRRSRCLRRILIASVVSSNVGFKLEELLDALDSCASIPNNTLASDRELSDGFHHSGCILHFRAVAHKIPNKVRNSDPHESGPLCKFDPFWVAGSLE